MKRFTIPKMTVVQLSNDDVIRSSACTPYHCPNFYCDDCFGCEKAHRCEVVFLYE